MGRIAMDGLIVAGLTLESFRRQIGVVRQDVFLFGDALRENIG